MLKFICIGERGDVGPILKGEKGLPGRPGKNGRDVSILNLKIRFIEEYELINIFQGLIGMPGEKGKH